MDIKLQQLTVLKGELEGLSDKFNNTLQSNEDTTPYFHDMRMILIALKDAVEEQTKPELKENTYDFYRQYTAGLEVYSKQLRNGEPATLNFPDNNEALRRCLNDTSALVARDMDLKVS